MAEFRGANRGVIHRIARSLSQRDIHDIRFLCADKCVSHDQRDAWSQCPCGARTINPGLELLKDLSKNEVFSVSDIEPLVSLLKEIGRVDLAEQCQHITAPSHASSDCGEGTDECVISEAIPTAHTSYSSDGGNSASSVNISIKCSELCELLQKHLLCRCSVDETDKTGENDSNLSPGLETTLIKSNVDNSEVINDVQQPSSSCHQQQPSLDIMASGLGQDGQTTRSTSVTSPELHTATATDQQTIGHVTHKRVRSKSYSTTSEQQAQYVPRRLSVPTECPVTSANSFSLYSSESTFYWRVNCSDLIGSISRRRTNNKKLEKKFQLIATFNSSPLKINLNLKLHPNGINWDMDKCSTLRVTMVPLSRLSAERSISLRFSITGYDSQAQSVICSRRVESPLSEREFVIQEFLSHDVVKISSAKYFMFKVSMGLKFCVVDDWILL